MGDVVTLITIVAISTCIQRCSIQLLLSACRLCALAFAGRWAPTMAEDRSKGPDDRGSLGPKYRCEWTKSGGHGDPRGSCHNRRVAPECVAASLGVPCKTLSTTAAISPKVTSEVYLLQVLDIGTPRTKVWPGLLSMSRTREKTAVFTPRVQLPIMIWLTREHSYT